MWSSLGESPPQPVELASFTLLSTDNPELMGNDVIATEINCHNNNYNAVIVPAISMFGIETSQDDPAF